MGVEAYRKALKAELADSYGAMASIVEECAARVRALEAELADAHAALRWYAGDGSTYDGIDAGQRARAFLQRYGKGRR